MGNPKAVWAFLLAVLALALLAGAAAAARLSSKVGLSEARLRQGFELPRVEADTKIRAKCLRALEDERFEVLPGDTYVKGFLRTYAEYLGLDGQLYVDEYNSRFAREEEFPVTSTAARRPQPRRMESNFVVVALAGN